MNAAVNQPRTPLEIIKRGVMPQFQAICQDEKKALQLYATATRLMQDPAILACTPESVISAFAGAVDLGLDLDPISAQIYFIPYGGKLTMQVGAAGYAKIIMRLSGWEIQSTLVFKCDEYENEYKEIDGFWEQVQSFKPNMAVREANDSNQQWVFENLRGVMAVARKKNEKGEWVIDRMPMSAGEVERRRLCSSNQKIGKWTKEEDKKAILAGKPVAIWRDSYASQAKKTAVKALALKIFRESNNDEIMRKIELLDGDSQAINSTARTVENEPAPTATVYQIQEIPSNSVADFSSIPTVNHNLVLPSENENFDLSPADVVDMETGEMPMTTAEVVDDVITKPLINFTEERYLLGSMKACKSNNQLVDFWESVPADLQEKYKEQFIECQDLMR